MSKETDTIEKKDIKKVEEHKVVVDTKETVDQNDDELTNRINRLYGISSGPEKEEKQYDQKELEEVRKKLIFLLMGVVLCGIIVLVILINPFDFGKKASSSENENNESKEEVEDDKEELPVGEIDLSNSTVIDLNNLVTFTVNDFMVVDLFPLYSSDVLESNNIPNNIKLYLLKENSDFVELLDNAKIDEYIKTCDENGVSISKEDFDNLVKKVFGPNTTLEYSEINYSYYSSTNESKKLTLSFENEQYIVRCNDYTTDVTLTKFIQQNLNKAIKTENSIEIYQNVVFINQNGVYKDPNFSELITNNQSAELSEYINQGAIYKYTFTEDEENYYLSKIEKVKETT